MWRTSEVIDGRYEAVDLAGLGEIGEAYQIRHRQWNIDLGRVPWIFEAGSCRPLRCLTD